MLTRSTLSDVVKYVQRTLADCTQFLCAGRAGFPEILQNFRANFAQNLHHLDAGPARYLALERHIESDKYFNEVLRFAQPRWPSSRTFCARGAPKFFGNFQCNFFARVGRKICVIPTLDACFFGSECNADSVNSRRRCTVCAAHAGRLHEIFVRGACRISGPISGIFATFRAIFAQHSRDLDAGLARYLASERTPS